MLLIKNNKIVINDIVSKGAFFYKNYNYGQMFLKIAENFLVKS